MHIRALRRTDADRIAEILAAGWAQAYSRFMPADILQPRIDPERRKIEIAEWLDDEFDPAVEALFVAENERGVGGFIHMELGDKGGLGATGIVNLLYVDAALQGRGVGRALMASGARWSAGLSCNRPASASMFFSTSVCSFFTRRASQSRVAPSTASTTTCA